MVLVRVRILCLATYLRSYAVCAWAGDRAGRNGIRSRNGVRVGVSLRIRFEVSGSRSVLGSGLRVALTMSLNQSIDTGRGGSWFIPPKC